MCRLDNCNLHGAWIRRRRIARNFKTPQNLADAAGYSEHMVRFIEADERRPTEEGAARLAKVLCWDEDERNIFLRVFHGEADVADLYPPDLAEKHPNPHITKYLEAQRRPNCPYPGMLPFTPETHELFFGREAEQEEIVRRFERQRDASQRLLALIGPSGSGKTSLIDAGIRQRLQESGRFGPGAWCIQHVRPGDQPLKNLATALAGDLNELERTISAVLATNNAIRLLLVVDPLEDLFTVGRTDAEAFQECVLQIVTLRDVYVLLAIRADFYGELMTSSLWCIINPQDHYDSLYPVQSLSGDALRQAIERPAKQAGVIIEDALVSRLVADAAAEPGAQPFVQETLRLLWDKLRMDPSPPTLQFSAYEELVEMGIKKHPRRRTAYGRRLSGLQIAMVSRADRALDTLPAQQEQEVLARRIFLRLIQFGDGSADTHRQQPIANLRAEGDDEVLFNATLQHLVEHRLLTLSGDEETQRVDLAHEALIDGWPTLQDWIKERKIAELARRRHEAKAAEWLRLEKQGGLLDAVELQEVERWLVSADAADVGLTVREHVAASRKEIEARAAEEEAVRQRELEQAKAIAEAEREKTAVQAAMTQRLKRRAWLLTAALVLALAAMLSSGWFWQHAELRAQIIRAQLLVSEGKRLYEQGEYLLGLRVALEGLIRAPQAESTERDAILLDVLTLARYGKLRYIEGNPFDAPDLHGPYLWIHHLDGNLEVWRTVDSTRIYTYTASKNADTEVSPDAAATYFTVSDQGFVMLHLSDTGTLLKRFEGRFWDFSPDAAYLALHRNYPIELYGSFELYDTATGTLLKRFEGSFRGFSPDAAYLAVETSHYSFELYDTATGTLLKRFEGSFRGFSPDAAYFTVTYFNNSFELYDTATGTLLKRFIGDDSLENRVVDVEDMFSPYDPIDFSSDAAYFVVESYDGSVKLYDTATRTLLKQFEGVFLGFSPDAAYLAVESTDSSVELYDTATRTLLKRFEDMVWPAHPNIPIVFSSNATYFVLTYENRATELWSMHGGPHLLLKLGNAGIGLFSTSFTLDSQRLMVRYSDTDIEILDTAWLDAMNDPAYQLSEKTLITLSCAPHRAGAVDSAKLEAELHDQPTACNDTSAGVP